MPTFVARQHAHPHHAHLPITRRAPEPGLINLPLPIPSIPILNPLVTPLVQGNNRPAPTTAPAPPPPPPPPPPGTPSPQPTSGGNGNGNGNGGGNSGGNGGGNGNGNGNGGGSTGGGTTPPSGGSSPPSDPSEGGPNTGSSPSSGSGSTPGSGSSPNQSPSGTGSSHTSNASSSPSLILGGDGNTPVNAGNDPSGGSGSGDTTITGGGSGSSGSGGGGITGTGSGGSIGTDGRISVSVPGVTGTPRVGGGNDGTGGGGGGEEGGGGGDGTGASKKGGISGGAVAGIIIFILLLILVCSLFLLRRRWRSRRSERRNKWWFARKRNSQTYGDNVHGGESGGGSGGNRGVGGIRRSVRSSFGTTVDHSQTPRLDMDFDTPTLPPMAELRREPLLVNVDSPTSPKVTVTQFNFSNNQNGGTTAETRYSIGTISSVGSDGQSQWLIVNRNSLMVPEIGTPMSVRPFSPTESFAFPKPPTDKNTSGDWSGSQLSRPASSHTLNTASMKSPIMESMPALPVPSPTANPFSDPDPIAFHAIAVAALGVTEPQTPLVTALKPAPTLTLAQAPKKVNDPFADPYPDEPATPRSVVHPEFFEIEIIKRPFIPNLTDELAVDLTDRVRILQMFDDGWALVEKNPVPWSDTKGKGRERKQPETGLIPIDCFRDAGLDVSSFIAAKRVSSYSQRESTYTYTAVSGDGVMAI